MTTDQPPDYVGAARDIGRRWAEGLSRFTRQRWGKKFRGNLADAQVRLRALVPEPALRKELASECLTAARVRWEEMRWS